MNYEDFQLSKFVASHLKAYKNPSDFAVDVEPEIVGLIRAQMAAVEISNSIPTIYFTFFSGNKVLWFLWTL